MCCEQQTLSQRKSDANQSRFNAAYFSFTGKGNEKENGTDKTPVVATETFNDQDQAVAPDEQLLF